MKNELSVSASDLLAEIQKAAEQADGETRYVRVMAVGEIIRQGDIYIERLADDTPKGAETGERQLAPGSSQGSRHVVEGDVSIHARVGTATPLDGPLVVVRGDHARYTHPEHAHVVCFQAGVFGVTYQRDMAAEMRRVED